MRIICLTESLFNSLADFAELLFQILCNFDRGRLDIIDQDFQAFAKLMQVKKSVRPRVKLFGHPLEPIETFLRVVHTSAHELILNQLIRRKKTFVYLEPGVKPAVDIALDFPRLSQFCFGFGDFFVIHHFHKAQESSHRVIFRILSERSFFPVDNSHFVALRLETSGLNRKRSFGLVYHFGEVDSCAFEEGWSNDRRNREFIADPFLSDEKTVFHATR